MRKSAKKKNWALRIMTLAFIFTLASTCLMSGTLAKYITTVNGYDTARVAQWGFNGINTVDIFDANYGTTVASAGGDNVIAPGTTKQFSFEFVGGSSEVASRIIFDISETNDEDIPIVYLYNGSYYSNVLSDNVFLKMPESGVFTPITITGDVAAMGAAIGANSAYANIAPNTSYNNLAGDMITWYWAFERADDDQGAGLDGYDAIDTALGTAGTATITLNIILTAEQID